MSARRQISGSQPHPVVTLQAESSKSGSLRARMSKEAYRLYNLPKELLY